MKKFLYLGFVLCLSLSGCSSHSNQTQGYIEGDLTYMSSSQSGKLVNLAITRGQEVHAGQVLFTIEPEPRNFALENAKASLEQAKQDLADLLDPSKRPTELASIMAQIQEAEAAVTYTQLELERNKTLVKLEAVQQEALDQAQEQAAQSLGNLKDLENQLATGQLSARVHQIGAAQASVEMAQSSLNQAAWTLEETIVKAPCDAYVFDNLYWPGEEVPMETPVISLLVPSQIKVLFYVPETALAKLKLGEKISFSADGVKVKTLGTANITYISPNAEYTPPVIYSRDREDQLVYRVEASFMSPKEAVLWHPGEPVTVNL